jgi:hypothetical protein
MINETKESHPACRSLMQKAVRRGDSDLAVRLAQHLYEEGWENWVKARTGVIVFEECWNLGGELDFKTGLTSVREMIDMAAKTIKNKDAAGLGSFAFGLSEGENFTLGENLSKKEIKIVAEAIRRPENFWSWAASQAADVEKQTFIAQSKKAYTRASWPWDKAFVLAGAYLSITKGIPKTEQATTKIECPVWVGLDKHTPQGKFALSRTAYKLKIEPETLYCASFYSEGALLNQVVSSGWWESDVNWRLKLAGLNLESSMEIWQKAKPIFLEVASEEIEKLQQHVDSLRPPEKNATKQLNLI